VFGDRRINRYFYEVAPEFATPERPAYSASSGLMLVRTGLFATRRVNPDLRLFGFVRFESYAGAANRDSPLTKRSTGASAGFGFAWTLARSQASARD
jgi:outer membrane scaffolding protein for murein synthesis (MipA/OmpV family)